MAGDGGRNRDQEQLMERFLAAIEGLSDQEAERATEISWMSVRNYRQGEWKRLTASVQRRMQRFLNSAQTPVPAPEMFLWSYRRVVRTPNSERWLVALPKSGDVLQIDYHFASAVEATVVVLAKMEEADLLKFLRFVNKDLLSFLSFDTDRAPFELKKVTSQIVHRIIDGSVRVIDDLPGWIAQLDDEP